MFGRKGMKPMTPSIKMETIIGKDVEIKGVIIANSGVRVEGKVEGEIRNEGDTIIGKNANVKASVRGRHLTLAGEMEGNVDLTGRLEIESSGRLKGDVKVGSLLVADGAVFDGNMRMNRQPEVSKLSEEVPSLPT